MKIFHTTLLIAALASVNAQLDVRIAPLFTILASGMCAIPDGEGNGSWVGMLVY